MSSFKPRLAVLSLSLATTVALTGCQATTRTRSMAPSDQPKAAICPKCEVVWVEGLDMNDPYMGTYQTEKVMRCSGCESAIANFFETGKLASTKCTGCGGKLKQCTRMTP